MFFQLRNRVGCHFLYLSVGLGDPHELDASSWVEIDHPKRMEISDPTIQVTRCELLVSGRVSLVLTPLFCHTVCIWWSHYPLPFGTFESMIFRTSLSVGCVPWAPTTMKKKGFGHLKTRLFTIKTSKNVGFGGSWYVSSLECKSSWDLFQRAMKRKKHLKRLKLEPNFERNKNQPGDICHHVSYWLVTTWRIIPVSNWLGSSPFISHEKPIWKGNNHS